MIILGHQYHPTLLWKHYSWYRAFIGGKAALGHEGCGTLRKENIAGFKYCKKRGKGHVV